VLEAVINKQGSVENLRVINGHPLLIQSALDAVKQWKYKPTLLNGEAGGGGNPSYSQLQSERLMKF
jgi:protein TonB